MSGSYQSRVQLEKTQPPSVFDFLDFRQYLKELFEFKRLQQPYFSMRVFSRLSGFRSPNYMSLILSGKRKLTAKNIRHVIKACRLNRKEGQYFETLVQWNQADPEDRDSYFEELSRTQLSRKHTQLQTPQSVILGQWYCYVIRELVLLPDFQEDPKWISNRLAHQISPNEVELALNLLIQLELLKRSPSGRLIQSDPIITTTHNQSSALIRQYHRDLILRSLEALESQPVFRRDFRALTMALSENGVLKLKKALNEFQDRVVQIASQETDPTEVFQLNLQLFPFTKEKPE